MLFDNPVKQKNPLTFAKEKKKSCDYVKSKKESKDIWKHFSLYSSVFLWPMSFNKGIFSTEKKSWDNSKI